MTTHPKTIQIFLPSGDPQGIRIAEITTRIVQVIEIPRSLVGEFTKMPECGQVAMYFLFGENDQGEPAVYIGQTGDLKNRLNRHNSEKDFWEKACIVISKTNSLTQTHAIYLEWLCIKKRNEANRYADANGNAGSEPYTPAPLQADCMEFFDTAEILLSTLGYPVFDAVARETTPEGADLFYCTRPGVNAQGQYTTEGFVVFEGSTGSAELSQTMVNSSVERKRKQLIESGIVVINDDTLTMTKNYLFGSPSIAAACLTGKSSNGWIDWKDKGGRTLDEVIRRPSND